jgi:hypothetical protein
MGMHPEPGGGDASPGSVRQIALASGSDAAQAPVHARGASVDSDPCGDLVGVERQDAVARMGTATDRPARLAHTVDRGRIWGASDRQPQWLRSTRIPEKRRVCGVLDELRQAFSDKEEVPGSSPGSPTGGLSPDPALAKVARCRSDRHSAAHVGAREAVCRSRRLNPGAETRAASERRRPVRQNLLASCARHGSVSATRQPAHGPR